MDIPSVDLARIRALYARGLYPQAGAAAEAFGPARGWRGPAAQLLGGRLAVQLGAPRIGRQLHIAAYRGSPAYPEAVYYHARLRLERFGPYSCGRFLRLHPDWSDAPPELRSDWLALHALVAARLKDSDRATAYLARAEAACPDRPWLYVERSSVLELCEQPDEALAAARQALALQPWFRPGVQAVAHLLQRRGRDTEAVELLTESGRHIESGVVVAQLASLQLDLGRHHDARASLDQYAELSPWMVHDVEVRKWLAARRADVAYLLGEPTAAADHARQVGEEFYTAFADRLERLPASHETDAGQEPTGCGWRALLPLDLSADGPPPTPWELLGRFWNVPPPTAPADTVPPTGGLTDAADRHRLETDGWVCREFTLTATAALDVIHRGLPFLVTFVEAGFGQSRFVVGADRVRGTLFLVDGSERRPAEAPVAVLVERYQAFGPRCLVAVPAAQAGRLDGLDLPDAEARDELYRLQVALLDLRFAPAKSELETMQRTRPGHRLTKFAALAWARGTGHTVLLLDALNDLRLDTPHDPALVLAQGAALRELGRLPERLALLRSEGLAATAEPLVAQSYAQMLLPDPTATLEASRILRRSVRNRPHAAAGYFLLAAQAWERASFAEAVDLYRAAACLDDQEDQFADAYARAAVAAGQGTDPLRLFQQRAARAAVPSATATRALFTALWERDEPDQAFAALGGAIDKLRANPLPPPSPSAENEPDVPASASFAPALGELLLFRSEAHANFGRFAEADADLTAARSLVAPAVWARSAARVARTRPDYKAALGHLQELLTHDPVNADAHRLTAVLLSDTEGRAAARRHLASVTQRYPYYYPLLKLRAEFLGSDADEGTIHATRAVVDLCPHDAWAQRQLALVLADRKRHDEALTATQAAAASEPSHPSHFAVLAHIHQKAGRPDDALTAFRDGLAAYPDHEFVVFEFVQACPGLKEKKAALRYLAEQLHAKPHTGDGLLAYFEQAVRLIDDPDEADRFLTELEQFLDERPDLWQSWAVVTQQLVLAQRVEEAVATARQAADRFPLVARVWVDLAEALRAAGHADDRLEALRRAVAVTPGWVPAARELSAVLAEAGCLDDAVRAAERVVPHTAVDPMAHWALAERLWQADRGRDALERAKQAVRLDTGGDPRAEVAWSAVQSWADRLDEPNEAVELARELARDRAGDPRAWVRLARCLTEYRDATEALAALDHAVRLDPKNVEAHDLRAERLAALGRWDEAAAAARPVSLVDDLPVVLQGRAAWVEARRGNFAAAIPPMQALVAVDPEYYWGWQQLAEWYNETGRPQNYLEAAGELARLRPDSPISLMMRGDARLQTGDRDNGKADLRDALRVSPGFSPAAVVLFDACLADDETREARAALAVLQEHLTGPEGLVKQIQFAARTGDADGAVRAFGDLCETPSDGPAVFLQAALIEMHRADLADEAATALRRAWESGEPFHPWAALYWLDTPEGDTADPATRLEAVDAAIRHFPGFAPGHDRRAEVLAHAGRFDEATAACAPAALGEPAPVPLRGRAAWVAAQRGDRLTAIEQMRQLVDAEPGYTWGWRQLAEWYDAVGQPEDAVRAADHLVRTAPNDPVALAIRGEARRAVGDHRGAKADFQKAFDLDPSYDAAGLQLVAAQLSTDDLTGAAEALAKLRANGNGPLVKLRAVEVAARRGDLPDARDGFRSLLTDARAVRGVLRDAATALTDAGWGSEADEELDAAVTGGSATPHAAGLWVERLLLAGQGWKAADNISDVIAANRDAGREAVLTYAWAQAAARESNAAVTVQRFADLLREDDEGWARAGDTLATVRNFPLTVAWLGDWKDRPGCRPWMLRPLADALRALGRDDDADGLTRRVVEAAAADEVPPDFLAWLAVTAAVEGRTNEAVARLRVVDPLGQPDGVKLLLAIAGAVVAVQSASGCRKAEVFADAQQMLRTATAACRSTDTPPGAARWYRRAVDRIAVDAGTVRAKLWAWWQRVVPWVRE